LPFDGSPSRPRQRARRVWIAGTLLRGAAMLLAVVGLLVLAGLGRISG
jgi:hypothetical protein